jgi:predicted AAA+ superfamily ATPase
LALTDAELIAFNPWWRDAAWRNHDPHLLALDDQPVRLPADFVLDIDLDNPGVSVLRGPRQVGKSTDLKLLVDRALDDGWNSRAVIYLALDLLEDQPMAEFARSVRRAKELSDAKNSLVLLDEVTSVQKWQGAVKALWDAGVIRGDVVVCTGSSAVDLQQGAAERLPGRRNGGQDYLVLPQSFASFACATDNTIPRSPRLTIRELRSPSGADLLQDMRLHLPALDRALMRYLSFGGLPAAVAEAVAGAEEPSSDVKRILWDSLVRELQRKGASIPAGQALLARVGNALGSETNWTDLAREMDVPLGRRAQAGKTSHHTLKNYVELLAGGYFIFIAYFWKRGQNTNDLSKNKKLFFADPLLHTVALDRAPGLKRDVPALVENAVGLALYRRYERDDRLAETFIAPDRLHIWKTAGGGEIDFVAGAADDLDVVEVKYRNNPGVGAAAAAAKAHPGRPVVMATKHHLDVRANYTLIPASLLVWALG